MSELNNLSDIKENFDTIKSLLNSIRAQDVLNAGDMNKLLNVINNKLDRIDQEDNLELMNSAISTMRQSLDERHSVLISKFSTIESLFSNILKNSVDSLKSSEIKELFDIIATNLSVFSREVVSQKDTLTDIILRIEALRTDDSSTGTIISNLDVLKKELERFNNGFESIIVNLGDNFGTIVRALDDIRNRCADNHYDKDFENLYMTSNSILASIQVLDKKSVQIEETLANILAKCENKTSDERLSELLLQNKEIYSSIGELAVNCNVEPLYQKIDNASALINSLKDILQNVDTDTTNEYLSKLAKIETAINKALDDNDFSKIRLDLEGALNQIANTVNISQNDLYVIKNDLETVASSIKALDIHVNFQNIQSSLTKSEVNIKTYISDLSSKFSQLSELTFQRTVEDIKQKVDTLTSEIKTVAGENLEALSGSLIGLKSSITDIETASGAANSLLFKNVTERLAALENTLAGLLNNQSIALSSTGKQMTELSGNVNLKLDTLSADFSSAKEGMDGFREKLEAFLSLDLQETFNILKEGIINAQTELSNGVKDSLNIESKEQFEKVNLDFETVKQQVETCSSGLVSIYKDGLSELRSLLNNITSSLIDILSYVSVTDNKSDIEFDKRFTDIEYSLKDYSSEIVDKVSNYLKECIEKINTRLTNYDANTQTHFQNLATKIESNSTFIREDIKKSYEELSALKNEILEFKEYVIEDLNNNPMKAELLDRFSGVRNALLDKLSEFELQYNRNNQARWEEFQTLNNNIINKIESIPEANRSILTDVRTELANSINELISNSMSSAIEEIKLNAGGASGISSQKLDEFKDECNKIFAGFKAEIPGIIESVKLDDKLEVIQSRIISTVSDEINKSFASILSILQNKIESSPESDDKNEMLDILFSQEKKIKSDIAVEIEMLIKEIGNISRQADTGKADIVNRLETLGAGITRALEKNELNQTEITEKLEMFGNTLLKMANGGGLSVQEAVARVEGLADKIKSEIGEGVTSQNDIIEKIEQLSIEITKLINQEASVKTGETLAKLLEQTDKNSTALFSALQQLSTANAKYSSDINDSLTIIRSDLSGKDRDNESKVIDEILSVKSMLDKQLLAIDDITVLCNDISDKTGRDNISALLDNLKTDIITQMLTIFNQISFSTEQEEILNSIKLWQDELRSTIGQLGVSLEEIPREGDKIISTLNTNAENISAQISGINDRLNNITGSDNYSLLNIEADIAKLRLSLGQLKDSLATASVQSEISETIGVLNNSINMLRSELPVEAIEYLRVQVDKLIANIQLNDTITSNIAVIKEKLESIDTARELFRADVERAFNNVISTIEKTSDFKSLREALNTGLKDISAKLDNSTQSAELNAMLSAILAKQDANLAHIVAHIGTVNNLDVLTKQDESTGQILAKQNEQFEQITARLDLLNSIDTLTAQEESTERILSKIEKISSSGNVDKNLAQILSRLNEINTAGILEKQDKNLLEIIAKIEQINNSDVLEKQDRNFEQIISKLDGINNADILNNQNRSFEQILSRLEGINNIDILNNQTKSLEQIISKIDGLGINSGLLDTFKSEIITQLIGAFNQISFEAETIELKTEIEEAHKELKESADSISSAVEKIGTTQSEFIEDYTNSLNRIEDSIENNHVFQLKAISEVAVNTKEFANKFAEENQVDKELLSDIFANGKELSDSVEVIKAQLKAIQESDEDSSQYSLSDIERDLTKLRLVVSELNSNQNKRHLETVINSIDTVISQIQELKESLPINDINNINENTSEILDGLENLVLDIKNVISTQDDIIGYVQDEAKSVVTELKASEDNIKSDIQMSLDDFAREIKEFGNDTISSKLSTLKNEIITQLLNVVSQISFVEEQEEIISHIDNLQAQVNILSSGDPDTIGTYSLQDIETDVAKLRVTLEEIKKQGRGDEIDNLAEKLSEASQTLEFLKTELPNHEIGEVREELEKIANDIISISIRTNKLLISSDESYKNLKENIEDFRNIMGSVEERTKNLYEEVGMDKIEYQVTSIKDIVGRQEITNQAFNEVFEYLAEWIDSTEEKLGYITDRLNNTEDINEIKLSLEDIKNSTSVKFEIDAQSDKIDAMESKLNVIIETLEPTFQNQQERMQVLERKINRIVDFFEPAFTKQQEKINKLETMLDKILDVVSSDSGYDESISKLEKISEIISSKDDTQLVKKIASFERQISKLNKNVEKLTAYVNEK